ncbi:peptidase M64 [candidate division KSB1 bacterium]|nr:peptidase M64 [candidate division KSB1 bacterium]
MLKTKPILLVLLFFTFTLNGAPEFDLYFINKTMRVDYFHTGTAATEHFSLDRIYQEGEWPGNRINLIDTLDLGKYILRVYDLRTNVLIYSRGYSTIFDEWQTTHEAKQGTFQTFHETVRFPFPKNRVKIALAVRDRHNHFVEKYTKTIDPASRFVNLEQKKYPFKTQKFIDNGKPENKVDIVILGDGYKKNEIEKFHKDVKRYTNILFVTQPFKDRKSDFNIWLVDVESQDSGIDEPRENKWRHTALGASYNSFDSPRYVLTLANKELRDIAALVPYDQIYILINSPRYGGGGIFNLYSISFTGSEPRLPEWWSEYVFVHEFGHAFGGLADEYYTSNVSYDEFYPAGVEPWEPNITRLADKDKPKWSLLITPGTPVPTPWPKAKYDSLGVNLRQHKRDTPEYIRIEKQMKEILNNSANKYGVGCYEGAGYASTDIYRPSLDCRMFSKSLVEFCPVCQKAINKVITLYTR